MTWGPDTIITSLVLTLACIGGCFYGVCESNFREQESPPSTPRPFLEQKNEDPTPKYEEVEPPVYAEIVRNDAVHCGDEAQKKS